MPTTVLSASLFKINFNIILLSLHILWPDVFIALQQMRLSLPIHTSGVIVVICDSEYIAFPHLRISTLWPQAKVTNPADSV
jgi:hypothetical protein